MTTDKDRELAQHLRFRADALEQRNEDDTAAGVVGRVEALQEALTIFERQCPGLTEYVDAIEARARVGAAHRALVDHKAPKVAQVDALNAATKLDTLVTDLATKVQIASGGSLTNAVDAYIKLSRSLADALAAG